MKQWTADKEATIMLLNNSCEWHGCGIVDRLTEILQSVQIVEIEEHKQMVHEMSMCMIGVQIYYTVYDRRTRVRYVLQQ